MLFDKLVALQDRILAITVRSEGYLTDKSGRDAAALAQARWELARLLREYQLYKHNMIFDPAERRGGTPGLRAKRMRADCIRVGEEFRNYLMKWSVVGVGECWTDYQPAALRMIGRIRDQLASDRAGIAALLHESSAA